MIGGDTVHGSGWSCSCVSYGRRLYEKVAIVGQREWRYGDGSSRRCRQALSPGASLYECRGVQPPLYSIAIMRTCDASQPSVTAENRAAQVQPSCIRPSLLCTEGSFLTVKKRFHTPGCSRLVLLSSQAPSFPPGACFFMPDFMVQCR